jgi:hypothetical protein
MGRRLIRWLARSGTAEADRVADAVGDLPLAVEQAGSLLADTGMAVDKYLRLLDERAQDVLDHDPGGAYPQSVAASWAVAFDRLAIDDPTALDLLTVVAWVDPLASRLQLQVTWHVGCGGGSPRIASARCHSSTPRLRTREAGSTRLGVSPAVWRRGWEGDSAPPPRTLSSRLRLPALP